MKTIWCLLMIQTIHKLKTYQSKSCKNGRESLLTSTCYLRRNLKEESYQSYLWNRQHRMKFWKRKTIAYNLNKGHWLDYYKKKISNWVRLTQLLDLHHVIGLLRDLQGKLILMKLVNIMFYWEELSLKRWRIFRSGWNVGNFKLR